MRKFGHAIFLAILLVLTAISYQSCEWIEQEVKESDQILGPSERHGEPYTGKGDLDIYRRISYSPNIKDPLSGTYFFNLSEPRNCTEDEPFDYLFFGDTNWYSSTNLCSTKNTVAEHLIGWLPFAPLYATYDSEIFQNEEVRSEALNEAFCFLNDSYGGGISVVVKKNDYFPQLPQGHNLDLNFYKNILQYDSQLSFARSTIGTYFNEDGLLDYADPNEVRREFHPGRGEVLGVLVEGPGFNFAPASERVESVWSGSPVLVNFLASPDGQLTADGIEVEANSTRTLKREAIGTIEGRFWTFSFFMKTQWSEDFTLDIESVFSGAPEEISAAIRIGNDLQVISASGNSVKVDVLDLKSGWKRISWSIDTNYFTNLARPQITFNNLVSSKQTFAIWGFQLEHSRVVTSYIPTEESKSYRAGDDLDLLFSNWMNKDNGTFLLEWYVNDKVEHTDQHIAVSDNRFIRAEINTKGQFHITFGTFLLVPLEKIVSKTYYRSVFKYTPELLTAIQDGNPPLSRTAASGRPIGRKLSLGRDPEDPGKYLNGHLRRVAFWPFELSDRQAIDMTSRLRHSSPYSAHVYQGVREQTNTKNIFIAEEASYFSLNLVESSNSMNFSSDVYDFSLDIFSDNSGLLDLSNDTSRPKVPVQCTGPILK